MRCFILSGAWACAGDVHLGIILGATCADGLDVEWVAGDRVCHEGAAVGLAGSSPQSFTGIPRDRWALGGPRFAGENITDLAKSSSNPTVANAEPSTF